ncbi:MAG: undecaprenyl/decaprenyl-phosphate alpha-N-acetylglucosaminyl 1-phosphate transferase [Alicyclobacillus macrosporangiidus]|uniref:MraY family glycosyltransferase n=1 Tax=Alicyclobacillus macrosporangiidus TaxID=392015 RepID=UPI0026EAF33F|nr:MraY family glycosyltransferase [Alicyclobacillus macrosporangiidus]MCL6600488.1 undecaprenyl/decaprenyl-phosphate alpha-N-acetylglucosaminyl 1-phosphate transferase [Alicyclobacillus macrosporangiidus]
MTDLAVALAAFAVSWLLVPPLRRVALRWRFVDLPNARKVHKQPLPLLGGAAILAGFLAASLAGSLRLGHVPRVYWGMLAGSVLLFTIGLVDDYYKTRGRDFPASPRFVTQLIAAAVVAGCGGTVRGFSMPFGHPHFVQFPAFISILVTLVWIVGVINVFNFLDGLDGLAAGIASISAGTLLFIAIIKGDAASALWAAALTGAALGFLRHNFYPARIIMGDAGSTLLGFLLASIAVIGAFKSATVVSIFVPVLALGVPILDGLRVVIRRALEGRPVYKPDKTHGHHRLLSSGFSQVQAVTFMYLLSACFSLASMILVLLQR